VVSPPRSLAAAVLFAPLVMTALLFGAAACTSSPQAVSDRLGDVQWERYVRDCSVDQGGSGLGTVIDNVVKAELTGDEFLETLVVDRCESSTSYWPQLVEVFDGASDPAAPRRLGLMLDGDPEYPRDVTVTVESDGRVVLVGRGLSATAPLCCPDITIRRVYEYEGGAFKLVEATASPPVSTS
jgi:hypothetical protein